MRKCMLAPIWSNNIMASLRSAVIAHDNWRVETARQEIGQETFSGVSETKIDDDIGTQSDKLMP